MQPDSEEDKEEDVVANKLNGVLSGRKVPSAFVGVSQVGHSRHLEGDLLHKPSSRVDNLGLEKTHDSLGKGHVGPTGVRI